MADITKPLADLEEKWHTAAKAPPYTADDDVESGVLRACADELHAVRVQLDEAIAALRPAPVKCETHGLDMLHTHMYCPACEEEPMACGHPRACWTEPPPPPSIYCSDKAHCTACARERLRVAAALRKTALGLCFYCQRGVPMFDATHHDNSKNTSPASSECFIHPFCEATRVYIEDSDRSALDAYVQEKVDQARIEQMNVDIAYKDQAVLEESEWWADGMHDATDDQHCVHCQRLAANRAKVR